MTEQLESFTEDAVTSGLPDDDVATELPDSVTALAERLKKDEEDRVEEQLDEMVRQIFNAGVRKENVLSRKTANLAF